MAKPAKPRIVGICRIDRLRDGRRFFRPFRLEQDAEPVAQKRTVHRRVGQRKRVEARRLAGVDPIIGATNAAHEQFGAAVLVEQDGAGFELLRLRGEEVHHHRLARTGRTDDGEIAQIAVMEIEEEGRCARRLQQRDRVTPVIAARLPQCKPVERAETRHVRAGDERTADQKAFVSGKLAPEGRFEIGVFAHRDRAGVGHRRRGRGHGIVQPVQIGFAHQHGQVMIAETDVPSPQRIARRQHVPTFGLRFLVGGPKPPDRKIHALPRGLTLGRSVALADDHLVGQSKQRIEETRRSRFGIILQAEHGSECGIARTAHFHRIEAEAHPAIGQHLADVGVVARLTHRTHLAVVKRRQQFQHFGIGAVPSLVIGQQLRAVCLKRSDQTGRGRLQRAHVLRIGQQFLAPTGEHLAGPLRQAGLAPCRTPDQRNELVVDEQRAGTETLLPARIDMA